MNSAKNGKKYYQITIQVAGMNTIMIIIYLTIYKNWLRLKKKMRFTAYPIGC